jgi:uncharacterized protein YcbK (DUF882 family)
VKLTRNFTLEEFEASETATRRGIANRVPNELLNYARRTAEMLQRIRDFLTDLRGIEIPINLTSGYRSLTVNRAIGSADTSDHVQALAADWRAPAFGTPTEICQVLAGRVDELQIGQLINEYPTGNGWVHTGARTPTKLINRIITITHDGTKVGVHAR